MLFGISVLDIRLAFSTMGNFYVDDTIQTKGGFVLGAVVYSKNDLTPAVFDAIKAAGLRPGIDEFKSGAHMQSRPERQRLRDLLKETIQRVGVGVVVAPYSRRADLGEEVLVGLKKFIIANKMAAKPHEIFLDEGIECSQASLDAFTGDGDALLRVHRNQDSRVIGGIQIADLAAHSMGIMLLEHQGLTTKKVKAGENSGYDPDLEVEIGFEMWATLRYTFLKAPQPNPGSIPDDPVGDLIFNVKDYGLHVAASSNDELRNAAVERFGECYLGCIH